MSKYFKSGPSRYLNRQLLDKPESKRSTDPGGTAMVRNSSAYTDNDERLFKDLNSAMQFSTNTRHAPSHQGPGYTTPYTTKDIELFDSLLSDSVG